MKAVAAYLAAVYTSIAMAGLPDGWVKADGGYSAEVKGKLDNQQVLAEIKQTAPDEYEMSVTARNTGVYQVTFPWEASRTTLGSTAVDDVYYVPRRLGIVIKSPQICEYCWSGYPYPGGLSTPIVVLADDSLSKLVAATNWPPVPVRVEYCHQHICMTYGSTASGSQPLRIEKGETRVFRCMVWNSATVPAGDKQPWHVAVDKYRTWLDPKLVAIPSPPWPDDCQQAEGWVNVQLENIYEFDANALQGYYERWRLQGFPWVQCWGQMAGYAGGCCEPDPNVHYRYRAAISLLRERVKSGGGRFGLYSRPRDYGVDLVGNATEKAFLEDWMKEQRTTGYNANYIDMLGGDYYGDLLSVAGWLAGSPLPVVIEFPIDVYKGATLTSGSCIGDGSCPGGPERSLQANGMTTYPWFVRYMFGDRTIFDGESNGGYKYRGKWATAQGKSPLLNYWMERQVLLLGAKFDAITLTEGDFYYGTSNPVIAAIVAERTKVGWWSRSPVFMDSLGVTNIPAGIIVKRFRTKDGKDLLAVDNPAGLSGTIKLLGNSVPLSGNTIEVIEK